MIHSRVFFDFVCTPPYRIAVSARNTIRLMRLDQQLAPPCKSAAPSNAKKFWLAISLAKGLPISSRASQNAAALLFDLGTVDVR
jgi:hypothetical protein